MLHVILQVLLIACARMQISKHVLREVLAALVVLYWDVILLKMESIVNVTPMQMEHQHLAHLDPQVVCVLTLVQFP